MKEVKQSPSLKQPVAKSPAAKTTNGKYSGKLESLLLSKADEKVNILEPCDGTPTCSCSGGGGGNTKAKVDLIVLIDTSSSMINPADAVSAAADAAIEAAQKACGADLRDIWLGVDTRQPGSGSMPVFPSWPVATKFTKTHEQYLNTDVGYTGPFTHDDPPYSSWPHEQGADAIADLSQHFDWRPGACRAVFYISDTNLDALGHSPADDAATTFAITQANANNVSVFAHYLNTNPVTAANYNDLCNNTGGNAVIGGPADKGTYTDLLKEVICNACREKGCKSFELPEIAPCFSVSWGDSECDAMETNDMEVLCIKVCNCYSNITFQGLTIGQVEIVDAAGNPVDTLPDGSPSVDIHPFGPVCFGNLGPCEDGEESCKSREIVLKTCGAKAGSYSLQLKNISFGIAHHLTTEKCFSLSLCKD